MTATSLIAQLRTLGVLLRSDGTRLIVDAPRGVITSELREQMARLKPDILSELEAEAFAANADSAAMAAIREIAPLLATAYRRPTNIPQMGKTRLRYSGDRELANSGEPSVHGGVP